MKTQIEFETITDEDLETAAGGRRRGRFFVAAPAYGYAAPAAYPAYAAAPAVPPVMPYSPYGQAPVSPYGVGYQPYGYGMRLGTAI